MKPASEDTAKPFLPPGVYVITSAILLAVSYPPFEVPYVAWIALVPLLLVWERTDSWLVALGQAYSVYVVMLAFALFWPILNEFPNDGLSALVSLLVVPLVLAAPFALSAPVRKHYGSLPGFLMLSSGSLVVEAALLLGPWSFPWLALGTTQAEVSFVLQLAEVGGVLALSAWLWLIYGLLLLALGSPRRLLVRLGTVVLVGLLVYGTHEFGTWRIESIASPSDTRTVLLVQPNLPDETWMDPYDDARVRELMEMSETALQNRESSPSLLVWPEMALPILGQAHQRDRLYAHLQAWIDGHQTPLLAGALTADGNSNRWDEELHFHKSAFFFRSREAFSRYDQTFLLPIRDGVSTSEALVNTPATFPRLDTPGSGSPTTTTFLLDQAGFAVLLDVEAWLGRYARVQATRETGFIVILTRSGWWANTPGYQSGLGHARIRAVETRRGIVQVANRGLSGVVLPDGSVSAEIASRGAWPVDVPMYYSQTIYTRLGDWPAALAGLLFLITGLRIVYVALGRKKQAG